MTTPTMISGAAPGRLRGQQQGEDDARQRQPQHRGDAGGEADGDRGGGSKPGRCEAIIPAAAPRNIAGKVGPPRKLASEIAHASPLKASSGASAPSDHVPPRRGDPGSWSWPENSTSLSCWSVASANAIASPATASPAAEAPRTAAASRPAPPAREREDRGDPGDPRGQRTVQTKSTKSGGRTAGAAAAPSA